MINNKRGIQLMGRTIIEILIAIVVVMLLFYAGYTIFQIYFGDQKEEQASGELGEIISLLEEMEVGEERSEAILTPKDWHFVSFDENANFVEEFEKPYIMQGQICLCICKDKKCEICQPIDKPAKMNNALFTIKIPKDVNIINLNDFYDFKEV